MIELTEAAADALHAAITGTSTPIAGLRLTVLAGGCSGYQYQMGLVENAEPTDLPCESRGLAVFIEPSSVALISGTTIDFVDSLDGAGFAFSNPQATSTCGCGKSFC
jgi:iron-sulfur cluster assembly accessory protein